MRADKLLENGAMAGAATWRRIVKAVEELQRQEPAPGKTAHEPQGGILPERIRCRGLGIAVIGESCYHFRQV